MTKRSQRTSNRSSKLTDRDEEWFRDKSLKERKLAVDGKPDLQDVQDLSNLFSIYDRMTGGRLRRFCDDLATERALNGRLNVASVDRSESITFALPQDLQALMERYYPTIWTNPAHARWFLRHFPAFRK